MVMESTCAHIIFAMRNENKYKELNKYKMKKILLFITAVVVTLSSFANDETPLVVSAGHVKNIELGSNMKVTLINAASLKTATSTNPVDVFEKLNIEVSNGNMRLEFRTKTDKNQRVYIIVDDLSSLTIGENTFVDTQDFLDAKKIKIIIADQSYVRLLTDATVDAYSMDGLSVDIQTKRFSSQTVKTPL